MAASLSIPKPKLLGISLVTWLVVLLVSDLTDAIWQALAGEPPAWLFWVKIGLLLAFVFAGWLWKALQPTRSFFFLLCVLMLGLWGTNWVRGTLAYHQWEQGTDWVIAMVGYQGLKLAVVLVMVLVLLMLGKRRKEFFLTVGQLKAPVKASGHGENPSKRTLSWGVLGLILGLCIAPLTLLFIGLGNLPTSDILVKALPYFPAALIFAATNAFAEEMQFRASLLGDLQKVVGPDQAIWLTASFFGFAHYFSGPPSGVLGVLITGLLGALFAKCMLSSKGLVVPWFIHFCQNVIIYAFMAIGYVA